MRQKVETGKKRKKAAVPQAKPAAYKRGERKGKPNPQADEGQAGCPVYKKCGGCQLLHMDYQKQLKWKRNRVSGLLKPYGRLEGIIGMENPEHYRHKVHAAFGKDGRGNFASGTYKESSHVVVPVKSCLLENEKADAIIRDIGGLLKSFRIKIYDERTGFGLLRHVLIRVGYRTGQIMVVLVLRSPILPSKNNFVKALREKHPEITTVVVNVNDKVTSMVLGEKEQVIYGPGYIEDELCGITFKISPRSFYQVNPIQAEVLYQKAIEYAGLSGRETVLDAYCGTGTIGMIAASKAGRVIGAELNREAVRDAIAGARQNQIPNARFYQTDAGDFMEAVAEEGERVDVVFTDPPRTGCSEKFLSSLVKLRPDKVVYVSCNPETLARDLGFLCEKGYGMKKGIAVDMFPFTDDIETVCLLGKKKCSPILT